jgi:hypothetical protein
MADITVDIDVVCDVCSNSLSCVASRSGGRLLCSPCDKCMDDAKKEGLEEGRTESP